MSGLQGVERSEILGRKETTETQIVPEAEVIRIGIDLDTRWRYLLDYVYFNALMFGAVTIKDSPSGKGYHIKVKLKKPITFPKSFEIRGLLRDDHHRLAQDEERYRLGLTSSIDILFDTKKKRAVKRRP